MAESKTITSKGPERPGSLAKGSVGSMSGRRCAHGSFGAISLACCRLPFETKAIPPRLVESCCFCTNGRGVLSFVTNGWSVCSCRSSHLLRCLICFFLFFHGSSLLASMSQSLLALPYHQVRRPNKVEGGAPRQQGGKVSEAAQQKYIAWAELRPAAMLPWSHQ